MGLTPEHRQEEWYQAIINSATGKYLPTISPSDAGKVMTVESDGSWGVESVPQELPTVDATDKDKYLHADAYTGYLEWSAINEVPAVGLSDKGKYLHSDASTGNVEWADVPTELPNVTGTDEGKVLTVNNSGEWVAANPSGGGGLPTPTAEDIGKVATVIGTPTKGAVIVPEQTVTFDSYDVATLSNTDSTYFTLGATVIITADGVGYTSTIVDNKGELQATFGNSNAIVYMSEGTTALNLYDRNDSISTISVNLATTSAAWGTAGNSINIVNFTFTRDEQTDEWSFTADKTDAEICAMTGKILAYCTDSDVRIGTPCWLIVYKEGVETGYSGTTDISIGSSRLYNEIQFGNYDEGSGFTNAWVEAISWTKGA